MSRPAAPEEDFWKRYVPEPTSGCWLWDGPLQKRKDGHPPYGQAWFRGRNETAHRVAWWLTHGAPGMQVCHSCDTPACVNPDHLFLGTQQDNMRDRDSKGRQASGDRQGLRKHPESVPRGVARRDAKLDDDKVREIRRRRAAGELLKVLATDYGLSIANVARAARGQTWGHVV